MILDLGCGSGVYFHLLGDVVGVDISIVALKKASEKGKVVLAVAEALPFKDEAFQGVFCSELLEHVEDDRVVVEEAFRVLRDEGVFVLSVPNGLMEEWHLPEWHSSSHRRLYTPKALMELFGEGLKFHSYGNEPLKELRLVASIKKSREGLG